MGKATSKEARLKARALLDECRSRKCWGNKRANKQWSKCRGCEIENEFQKLRLILTK